jgi:hypothetical protein
MRSAQQDLFTEHENDQNTREEPEDRQILSLNRLLEKHSDTSLNRLLEKHRDEEVCFLPTPVILRIDFETCKNTNA